MQNGDVLNHPCLYCGKSGCSVQTCPSLSDRDLFSGFDLNTTGTAAVLTPAAKAAALRINGMMAQWVVQSPTKSWTKLNLRRCGRMYLLHEQLQCVTSRACGVDGHRLILSRSRSWTFPYRPTDSKVETYSKLDKGAGALVEEIRRVILDQHFHLNGDQTTRKWHGKTVTPDVIKPCTHNPTTSPMTRNTVPVRTGDLEYIEELFRLGLIRHQPVLAELSMIQATRVLAVCAFAWGRGGADTLVRQAGSAEFVARLNKVEKQVNTEVPCGCTSLYAKVSFDQYDLGPLQPGYAPAVEFVLLEHLPSLLSGAGDAESVVTTICATLMDNDLVHARHAEQHDIGGEQAHVCGLPSR